jgi:hypothetical protein
MKRLYVLIAALGFLVLVNGCEVRPSYGAAYGVYGEYPTTYYGDYYYPAYPHQYGYWHRDWDHDHYWDRGHSERHPYRYHYRRGRDDEHHH